ncbi:MAG: hypothetical protein ABL860_00440 [Candidatus Nitrotoga sp.]
MKLLSTLIAALFVVVISFAAVAEEAKHGAKHDAKHEEMDKCDKHKEMKGDMKMKCDKHKEMEKKEKETPEKK